ncbi:NUDIX domain-containing protein [Paenibacillus sp.]|uniref:NUDIX hydrolase n=1 Tax=Paenibacillus sp. TaxID=58172 RepID=UPI002811A3B4|nr:NUDIX domain-containing protein [Paenibacillus sp.]
MAEMLDVFDESMRPIGVRSREEVHKLGLWHQTFQCWFVRRIEGVDFIYFQERHESKADFPGQLDITAAGHLSAGETLADGAREIEEELGVAVPRGALAYAGCKPYKYRKDGFIDHEFCHVHYYVCELPLEAFRFRDGEVSAIVLMTLADARRIVRDADAAAQAVRAVPERGERRDVVVRWADLVPHEKRYYEAAFDEAERLLARGRAEVPPT